MDACSLHYLLVVLALHNYLTLCLSLPEDVIHEAMALRDWTLCGPSINSDTETEPLLSNIMCIQQDRLSWEDLRGTGI